MIFVRSERLALRKARESDLGPLLETWADPETVRYGLDHQDIPAFVAQMIADMEGKEPGRQEPGGPWYQYIVERNSDGEVVGDVGVGFAVPRENQAELGYRIHPAHRRQGYAKEALAALIGHLIEAHAIHRFTATVDSANRASIAVLRALGFRHEGRSRESFCRGSSWFDEDHFGLLASEWGGKAAASGIDRAGNSETGTEPLGESG